MFWVEGACLPDQSPMKTQGSESLMSIPGWQHLTCVLPTQLHAGELSMPCVTPLG